MAFNDKLVEEGFKRVSDIRSGLDKDGLKYLRVGSVQNSLRYGDKVDEVSYKQDQSSYSGSDCVVAIIYNQDVIILGNMETISYSIHRDKMPVRTLGRTYAKGYVRGQRTIAGSMIFVQFNDSPLHMLYEFFDKKIENTHRFSSPLSDEIPPFDMMLIFNNEFNFHSVIRLYGVEIVDEGGTFSINDVYSENVMQFICKDMDPMKTDGTDGSFQSLMFEKMLQGKLLDPHYNSLLEYKLKLDRQVAILDKEVNELHEVATQRVKKIRRAKNANRNKRVIEANNNKLVAQQEYKAKSEKLTRVLDEMDRIVDAINTYEKTMMTWDMNASITKDATSAAEFR